MQFTKVAVITNKNESYLSEFLLLNGRQRWIVDKTVNIYKSLMREC